MAARCPFRLPLVFAILGHAFILDASYCISYYISPFLVKSSFCWCIPSLVFPCRNWSNKKTSLGSLGPVGRINSVIPGWNSAPFDPGIPNKYLLNLSWWFSKSLGYHQVRWMVFFVENPTKMGDFSGVESPQESSTCSTKVLRSWRPPHQGGGSEDPTWDCPGSNWDRGPKSVSHSWAGWWCTKMHHTDR